MIRIKAFLLSFILIFGFTLNSKSQTIPGSFADLAEKLMPSVVNISTTTTITTRSNPFPFQFPPGSPFEDMFKEFGAPQERKSAALGSGFIIDKKGIVVTNNHVIQDAEDIIIRINDDREFKAKVIGADPLSDIAVLQLETNEKFVPVKFGNSDKARIGDWVIAIGNPFGLGGTVTSGIISARNRALGLSRYEDYIQTDASINSGNSGGPLFDMNGDVIGINTAIISQTGSSIGIGLAIPVNMVRKVLTDLVEKGGVMRGFLGVELQASSFGEPGAIVGAIVPGSAADLASIKSGDRIIKVGEKFVDSVNQSRLAISQTTPGTRLPIELIRDGKRLTVFVTLDLLGGVKRISIPGISLEPLTSENRLKFQIPAKTKGVIVTQSTGEAKTFKEGVVIVEVNGYQVNSVRELEENIRKGSNRLYVWYRDKYRFLSYRVP